MAKKKSSEKVPITEGEYRGCKIAVYPKDQHTLLLHIDDKEIPVFLTANGVHTNQCLYKEFGTPMELAEMFIQQWGNAVIEPGEAGTIPHHHA